MNTSGIEGWIIWTNATWVLIRLKHSPTSVGEMAGLQLHLAEVQWLTPGARVISTDSVLSTQKVTRRNWVMHSPTSVEEMAGLLLHLVEVQWLTPEGARVVSTGRVLSTPRVSKLYRHHHNLLLAKLQLSWRNLNVNVDTIRYNRIRVPD